MSRTSAPLPLPRRVGPVQRIRGRTVFVDAFGEGRPELPFDGDAPAGTWVEVELDAGVALERARLAPPGSARFEVYALAAERGADPMHPPACEAEAAGLVAEPGIDDPTLVDLTDRPFATIDDPTSRDLDQALWIEPAGQGHVVWYALADAAWFVRPKSALWAEALRRGATYYLPGLVAPMLPRSLCEGLISLNPRVDRRAMVLRMEVGRDGRCRGTEVLRTRIRSRAKLSYQGVQAWLDGGSPPCTDGEVQESLRGLVEVGERRLQEAESRDVVRFRRRELSVEVGGKGLAFVAADEARNDVERFNEQVSLLTNMEGARLLRSGAADADVHPVFRTHEPPREELLRGFASLVEALVATHGLDPERWSWRPGGEESLAAYGRRLPQEPGPHRGVALAIQRHALRTGGRSGFQAEPARHHGVGAEVYSRFTAPMREVVGIFVHKELWELLGLQAPRPREEDERTRDRVLSVSQSARPRQRALDHEANRLVLDQLFARDLAADPTPARPARVMGLGRRKIYTQLEAPPLDLKVYAHDLEQLLDRDLVVDAGAAEARFRDGGVLLRVGDRVRVRVDGLDRERDRWRLGIEPARSAEPGLTG